MDANALMSVDPMVLGERLALARRARGLSQEHAAGILGVAQTTISAMEKGDRRPRPSELYAVARLYGRQLGDLLRPVRERESPSLLTRCLADRAAISTATEREREQDIQRCEDVRHWYLELKEMLGRSDDEGPHTTLQDRLEVLASQAFADALISEGRLARILATDRISAVRIVRERLQDA